MVLDGVAPLAGKLGEQDEARLLRDIDAIIAKTLVAAEPAMFEALYTSAHPTVAKEGHAVLPALRVRRDA